VALTGARRYPPAVAIKAGSTIRSAKVAATIAMALRSPRLLMLGKGEASIEMNPRASAAEVAITASPTLEIARRMAPVES
jgi:hypothetical protein